MIRQRYISTYISRIVIISSLLILMTNNVWGQEKTNIAIANTEDSIPLFRNISVSFDLVGLAQMAFGDYGQYEGGLRVNLKDKYFPVVEV